MFDHESPEVCYEKTRKARKQPMTLETDSDGKGKEATMDWTKELVIRGRRPTAKEGRQAARWLLWISDWPEHDGPEMYIYESDEDEDGISAFLYNPTNNSSLDCTPEPVDVVEDQKGEVWIGLDRTGARVRVPCSREEALEAAGWRDCVAEDVFDAWVAKGGWWNIGNLNLDLAIVGVAAMRAQWLGLYEEPKPSRKNTLMFYRPVDNVGNYAPEGWGKKGEQDGKEGA